MHAVEPNFLGLKACRFRPYQNIFFLGSDAALKVEKILIF
jgi:hypothetical protein